MKIGLDSVKLADYLAVAAFLEQENAGGFTKDQWREKFLTFWDRNPFFREDKHERGWLLRDEAGAVCGFLGNIPAAYVRSGQEEMVFALTSWFVRQDARTRSLALYGCFMKQEGVLLNTTPTPAVESILKKFKFTANDWIRKDYFFPVRTAPFARYLQVRFMPNALLRSAGLIAAAIARLISNGLALANGKRQPVFEIREIRELPADIEPWWDEFKKTRPFTLMRNTSAMRYYFFSGLSLNPRKVLEVRCQGKLVGFSAVQLVSKPEYSYVEVIDLALLDDEVMVYLVLMDKLKELACQWRPDVAYIKSHALSRAMRFALKRSGFWDIDGKSRFYFFDHKTQLGPDDFYGTPLDGDRLFF